mgnify:CR=1 FL=1
MRPLSSSGRATIFFCSFPYLFVNGCPQVEMLAYSHAPNPPTKCLWVENPPSGHAANLQRMSVRSHYYSQNSQASDIPLLATKICEIIKILRWRMFVKLTNSLMFQVCFELHMYKIKFAVVCMIIVNIIYTLLYRIMENKMNIITFICIGISNLLSPKSKYF